MKDIARQSRLRLLRWIEWTLLAGGIIALGLWGYFQGDAKYFQWRQARALEEQSKQAAAGPAPSTTPRPRASRGPLPAGALIGRLEIPRIGLSTMVVAGVDDATLRRAVGHIPGTALPGQTGTVGLAGHRDTFFRELRSIRSRDLIRLTMPEGVYQYFAEYSDVVSPDRTDVLEATAYPSLTLVTCYPFRYVGNAPKRFIVRARQVELAPGVLEQRSTVSGRPISETRRRPSAFDLHRIPETAPRREPHGLLKAAVPMQAEQPPARTEVAATPAPIPEAAAQEPLITASAAEEVRPHPNAARGGAFRVVAKPFRKVFGWMRRERPPAKAALAGDAGEPDRRGRR